MKIFISEKTTSPTNCTGKIGSPSKIVEQDPYPLPAQNQLNCRHRHIRARLNRLSNLYVHCIFTTEINMEIIHQKNKAGQMSLWLTSSLHQA